LQKRLPNLLQFFFGFFLCQPSIPSAFLEPLSAFVFEVGNIVKVQGEKKECQEEITWGT